MGSDDDSVHRERRWGSAAVQSEAATAGEMSETVLRGESSGREFIGPPGYAAFDATIAEGMGMGVSEPTPAPQSRLMFQRMTPSAKITTPAVNKPQHPSSAGGDATPRRNRGGGSRYGRDSCDLSGFLCHACGTGKRTRPTVCCRNCQKLYHPMCAGYEPSSRKYPPPDWICPECPGGKRGPNDNQVHASLRGKGTLTTGSQTWCPVCFKDNRVPGQWKSKSLDGGQKCPGCGLKAHAACLRLRADRTWPCVECQCRKEGLSPKRLFEAHSTVLGAVACSGNKSSSRERDMTHVRTVLTSPKDSESMQPHGEGDPGALASKAPEGAELWATFHASTIRSNADSSKRYTSEGRAHAGTSFGDKPSAPPALHAHGSSIPSFPPAASGEKLHQRKCAGATAVTAQTPVRAPFGWKPFEVVKNRGEARSFSNRGRTVVGPAPFSAAAKYRHYGVGTPPSSAHKPPLDDRLRRGTIGSMEAARTSRRSKAALGGSSAGASVVICKTCKKKGRLKSGRTCAGCKQWWHANADCSAAARGSHPDASDFRNWVGGWRCQGCLDDWEDGLRARTAEVVKAWAEHEKKRELKAREFEAAKEDAMAESVEAKRHGFMVDTVEVPPIPHPPAGILPFLDVSSIRDTGHRLARIARDDCAFMGPEGVLAKVDLCWEHRIFTIIEGVFDPQAQPLMDFLEERKGLSCRISGKAAAGESSSTMGDYRARLADRMDKPRKDSPGTFFLDTASGQTEVLNWLPTDPLMRAFMPESPRGGLEDHIIGDRCKFGPFTFGGGRNFPLESLDVGLAGRQSQRQYMKGKGRDRIGGSTTHMDGMGSFTAIGGLKDGVKRVTAFETADCATALAVAKFRSFAKPGGSSYVVNNRIDDDLTLRRRLSTAGVRFSTFLIRAGDAYLVPSGALHEFMNEVPCLSVAWNIMPHPANCAVAMEMAEASAMEAEAELGINTDRSQSAIEYAPPEAMRERVAGFVIKRWLERSLLRRRCKNSIAAGAPLPGLDDLAPAQAAVMWAELAARHEVPASVRKRVVCYWPNSDFYNESKPVFEGKMEAVGRGQDEAQGESTPCHGYSPALREVLEEATRIVTPQTVQPQTIPRQDLQHQEISPQVMQQETVPPQTVQKQSVPQQKVPPQTVPQQEVPPQTVPQQKVPPQTVPQQKVPPQTVPQQKVPPQTVTPQTVPQQKVPPRTVPLHTVSPQTVPQSALRMKEVHPYTSPTPSRVPLAKPSANANAKPPATPHRSPAPAPSVGLPPQAPAVGVASAQPPIVTPSSPVFGAPSSTAPPDRPLLATTCWMQPTSYSWLPAPPPVHGGNSKPSTGCDTIDVGLDPPGDAATCSEVSLGVSLALSGKEMVPSESDSTAADDPIDVGLDSPGGVVQLSHPTLNAASAQSMAGVTPNANHCGVNLTRGGSGPVVTEHALSSWCCIGDRNATAGISWASPEATFGSSGLVAPVGICTVNGDDSNGKYSEDNCSQGGTMQAIGGVNSVCPCLDDAATRKSVESGRYAGVSGESTGMETSESFEKANDGGNGSDELERRTISLSHVGIGTPESDGAERPMVVVGHSEHETGGDAACLGVSRRCDSPSGTHGNNNNGSKDGQERMVLGLLEGVENGRLASQVAGGDSAEDSRGAAGGERALMIDVSEVSPSKRLFEVPKPMDDNDSEASPSESVREGSHGKGEDNSSSRVAGGEEGETVLGLPEEVKEELASRVTSGDSACYSEGARGEERVSMNDDPDVSQSERGLGVPDGEEEEPVLWVAGGESEIVPGGVERGGASRVASPEATFGSSGLVAPVGICTVNGDDSNGKYSEDNCSQGGTMQAIGGVNSVCPCLDDAATRKSVESGRCAGVSGESTGMETSESFEKTNDGGNGSDELERRTISLSRVGIGTPESESAERPMVVVGHSEHETGGDAACQGVSRRCDSPSGTHGDNNNGSKDGQERMVLGLLEGVENGRLASQVAGGDSAEDSTGTAGGERALMIDVSEVSPSKRLFEVPKPMDDNDSEASPSESVREGSHGKGEDNSSSRVAGGEEDETVLGLPEEVKEELASRVTSGDSACYSEGARGEERVSMNDDPDVSQSERGLGVPDGEEEEPVLWVAGGESEIVPGGVERGGASRVASPEATFGSSGLVAPVGICTVNGDDSNGKYSEDNCSQGGTMQAIGGVNSVCPCLDDAATRKSVESGRYAGVSGESTGMETSESFEKTNDGGNGSDELERRTISLSRVGIGTPESEGAERPMVVVGHSEHETGGDAACLGVSRRCDSPSGTHGDNNNGSKDGQERMVLGLLEGVENGRLASQVAGGDSAEDSTGTAGGERALMIDVPEVSPSKRLFEVPKPMDDNDSEASPSESVREGSHGKGEDNSSSRVAGGEEDETVLELPEEVKEELASRVTSGDSACYSEGARGEERVSMNDDPDVSQSEMGSGVPDGEEEEPVLWVAGGESEIVPGGVERGGASRVASPEATFGSSGLVAPVGICTVNGDDSNGKYSEDNCSQGGTMQAIGGVNSVCPCLDDAATRKSVESGRYAGVSGESTGMETSESFEKTNYGGNGSDELERRTISLSRVGIGTPESESAERPMVVVGHSEHETGGDAACQGVSRRCDSPSGTHGDNNNGSKDGQEWMVLGLLEGVENGRLVSQVAGGDSAEDSTGTAGGERALMIDVPEVSPSKRLFEVPKPMDDNDSEASPSESVREGSHGKGEDNSSSRVAGGEEAETVLGLPEEVKEKLASRVTSGDSACYSEGSRGEERVSMIDDPDVSQSERGLGVPGGERSSSTEELSSDSSATTEGAAGAAITAGSNAPKPESGNRSQSSTDERPLCDIPGTRLPSRSNASSFGDGSADEDVEGICSKDLPPMLLAVSQPPLSSSTPSETKSGAKRGRMVARPDGDNGGDAKSVDERDRVEVSRKKLDEKQPGHSPSTRKLKNRRDHYSQSRSSSSGRSGSSRGRARVDMESSRSRHQIKNRHRGYDSRDRSRRENSAPRDRSYRKSAGRSRPSDRADRDRRRSVSSHGGDCRREVFRRKHRPKDDHRRDPRRDHVWGRDRGYRGKDRGRDRGRERGEGRERDISGGRRYSRERAIFAPRDCRGLISPRQKCLPRREGRDGRDRRPADDVSRHRFRRSGDRKNYSDDGRGSGKGDDYYFPRGSNARRGGRREASPKNASSKTNGTEPSEKDGVPKAAVGKRTTPTGCNLGSSSGDSGDTARHCPRFFLGRAGVLHRAKLVQNNVARKVCLDDRAVGLPDDAKSRLGPAPPVIPPVGHALMPPMRRILSRNSGTVIDEKPGRDRRLASAHATDTETKRRLESSPGSGGAEWDEVDGAQSSPVPLIRACNGSGNVEGMTAAVPRVSNKNGDQPTAVGGDAFKPTPVGRVCFRDDVKVSRSTGDRENVKADLKRRRPSHTGDADAGGVSRLRMENGFASQRYSAATKVRVDVASSSSSRASSAAAAAAAAASKAAGTVHARPLSGIGVIAERLRVGGGSFADVFTDPAALRLGASSNGWAESSRSSQHDVRPEEGGTCVGKKRERTVLGYSGPKRENPPDGGQSRASSGSAFLEERKKRCRRSS